MQRRRSTVVCLGLTAVLATSLAGCGAQDSDSGGEDPQYTGICVDKTTGVRLDDSVCENDPLPNEGDFQATSAVNAGADPAVGVNPTDGTATSAASPSSSTGTPGPGESGSVGTVGTVAPATTTGPATTPPAPGSPTGSPAPIPSCVPATGTGAAQTAATVTATLPVEASPTTPGAPPTLFEGACPPGQVPAGSAETPGTVTTTVYRHSTSHGWFFIPWGFFAPPIGSRATYGSYAPPRNTTYSRGGVTHKGGTVSKSSVSGGKVTTSRGGFGGSGAKGGS